jgi:hypothetical protein
MRREIEQLRSLTVAKAALNVAVEALDVERSKPLSHSTHMSEQGRNQRRNH